MVVIRDRVREFGVDLMGLVEGAAGEEDEGKFGD